MASSSPCSSFFESLSAAADGELSPIEQARLDGHLSACRPCEQRLAELRAQSKLISAHLLQVAESVDYRKVTQRVMADLPLRQPSKLSRLREAWDRWISARPIWVPALAGALAMALLVLPFLLHNQPRTLGAEEPLAVESVSTDASAHLSPAVMQTENGDAIIWLVPHDHGKGEPVPTKGAQPPPGKGEL